MTTLRLQDGTQLPAFGLGTWLSEPERVYEAVRFAIEIGYRHIDGADDFVENLRHELFVSEQRRACRFPADFFSGAAHVDIDDLCTAVNTGLCSHGKLVGFRPRNLYGDGFSIKIEVESMP